MASETKGNLLVPVWVDAGVVKALVDDSGTIPTTEQTPLTSLQAQAYGYVGTAWQKQPILYGYTDTVRIRVLNLNATAGTNNLNSVVVPAGEIWVITAARGYDLDSAITSSNLGVVSDTIKYSLDDKIAPAAAVAAEFKGFLVMKEADKLRWTGWGCTLNDDLYLIAVGYKMDIDL